MAKKYFKDSATQHSGLINLSADEIELIPSLTTLGSTSDEPATFCVRCRSVSNASSNYQSDADAGTREWINSLDDTVITETVRNGYHHQSCGDGADLPLLARTDSTSHMHNGCCRDVELQYCHTQSPINSANSRAACRQLLTATICCLIFMVAEIIGGYIAGSLAVLTDAAHLLSDLAGFGGGLLAMWLVRKPPSCRLTYGWARAEPLAAMASVLLLWAMATGVAGLAVHRLVHGGYDIDAAKMMMISALGVVINIVMGVTLHGGCSGFKNFHHGHSHGLPAPSTFTHDGYEPPVSHNINVRAAIIHVVGDLVQSVGVFISAVLIKFFPHALWIDPVCTLLCCILVFGTSIGIARDTLLVLMEASPTASVLQPTALASRLRAVEGVCAIHDLHVWILTPGQVALTAHLLIEPVADNETVLNKAQKILRSLPEIQHVTLQIVSR